MNCRSIADFSGSKIPGGSHVAEVSLLLTLVREGLCWLSRQLCPTWICFLLHSAEEKSSAGPSASAFEEGEEKGLFASSTCAYPALVSSARAASKRGQCATRATPGATFHTLATAAVPQFLSHAEPRVGRRQTADQDSARGDSTL